MLHWSSRRAVTAQCAGMLRSHSHLPWSQREAERGEDKVFPLQRGSKEASLGGCSVMPDVAGAGKKTSFSQLAPWKKMGVTLCCIC